MINYQLLQIIEGAGADAHRYWNLDIVEVRRLLVGAQPHEARCQTARRIAVGAMVPHLKFEIADGPLWDLLAADYAGAYIRDRHRDHLVHSVLVFLLGIAVDEEFGQHAAGARIRKLEWKLASLFHDLAYPLQLASEMCSGFSDRVANLPLPNGNRLPGGATPGLFLLPHGAYTRLAHHHSALTFLRDRIHAWGINLDPEASYAACLREGRIDHGLFSSLTLLHIIDRMYEHINARRVHRECFAQYAALLSDFNEDFFDRDVLSACAAILLHTARLDGQTGLVAMPESRLAYLLRLCDTLQEWDRPGLREPHGLDPDYFEIRLGQNGVTLIVHTPARGAHGQPGQPTHDHVQDIRETLDNNLQDRGEVEVEEVRQ